LTDFSIKALFMTTATSAATATTTTTDRHASIDTGLTAYLAARAAELSFDDLPRDAVELAKQCILDTLGVLIAGTDEPVAWHVRDLCLSEGSHPQAAVVWNSARVSARQAALINGTTAHALDYDDNNLTMPGHVSAVVLPAVLALCEQHAGSGRDLITAFVAGFETACSLGAAIAPGHYDRGFHATGTNGAFGATAGAARMMGLNADQIAHALSITASTASGLKGAFGTMCKPFHAGHGAANGVLAAQLAAVGLETRGDGIECRQGYAATHSPDFDPGRALYRPERGWHLFENLFKFHAACYGTHGAIGCALQMRQDIGANTRDIRALVLEVSSDNDATCNIAKPRIAAEARFSLRHVTAMGLTGYNTAIADAFGGESLTDREVIRLREATQVRLRPGLHIAHSFLDVVLKDGQTFHVEFNAGEPAQDLADQRERLIRKFRTLVSPVAGSSRCDELVKNLCELESVKKIETLIGLLRPHAA
jgi:2-methylcitrate dehydratase PrpD